MGVFVLFIIRVHYKGWRHEGTNGTVESKMLAAQYRFHGRRSMGLLFKQGRLVRGRSMGLKYVANPARQESRVAVVVGRKVTKIAPRRNRIRRRIFETVRVHWPELQAGYDLAFIVYDANLATASAPEVEAQVLGLLQKAGVIESLGTD